MRTLVVLGAALVVGIATTRADDLFDRVDDALTWSTPDGGARARLSGTMDLEGYALPQPLVPGLIDADSNLLFVPRLTTFLDAQLGPNLYAFGQARVDRGFDPSNDPLRARVDEYALRWVPDPNGVFNLQIGKFATVVGNWNARHGSWTDPFITPPLPYEELTGLWDTEVPHSAGQLMAWSHVRRGLSPDIVEIEKYLRIPLIWGPSYATGAAVAGDVGQFKYAFELKNASLSSRPELWTAGESDWGHPTVSGRVGWNPNESWRIGWSASSGPYLRTDALIPGSFRRGDYNERLLGQDVSFAWHHFQLWAEIYFARFAVPPIGNADVISYYVEAKYKFAPQFFAALRWNQQEYGTINDHGADARWGRDVWRIDFAPTYRLTPHVQLKLQYSLEHGEINGPGLTQLAAAQMTLRF